MAWLKKRGGKNRPPQEKQEPKIGEMGDASAPSAPPTPVPRAHGDAALADPFAFRASHRRLAWMLRLSAGTNIVLGACLVTAVSLVSAMLPLKRTEIALVRSDAAENRLYRIEPITERTEGFNLLMESMARRYVDLVLTIDPVTQTERYGEASRMTDRAFSGRLREERIETEEVRDAVASGLTREIRIESADALQSFGNDYRFTVDFTQVDHRAGEVVNTRKLRAYLALTTRPHEVREADKYMNPLGITVTAMTLKERGQ